MKYCKNIPALYEGGLTIPQQIGHLKFLIDKIQEKIAEMEVSTVPPATEASEGDVIRAIGGKWAISGALTTLEGDSDEYREAIDTLKTGKQNKNDHKTITIPHTAWDNRTAILTVYGVSLDNLIFVAPNPVDADEFSRDGIQATAQGENSITFSCKIQPDSDISVNIAIFD